MNREKNLTGIDQLPNEILIKIFLSLGPKSILECRAVCWRWQQNIDNPAINEKLWYKLCQTNYNDIYESAYVKSIPGISWYHLFKSLTLWSQLSLTRNTILNIDLTTGGTGNCCDCQVLRDGIIGVLTNNCILYYNVDTLQVTQVLALSENNEYCTYKENDDIIVLSSSSGQLFIRRKDSKDVVFNIFDDVHIFMLLENVIYFVTNLNTMFKCTFVEGICTNTYLLQVPEKVQALGHKNGTPSIFTRSNNIYSYINNALIKVPRKGTMYPWKTVSKYNLSDNLVWKNMFTLSLFYCVCRQCCDCIDLVNISQIRIHGPIIIVGYIDRAIRIFYSMYTTSVFHLLNSEPSKAYYLLTPHKDLSDDFILQIDVVEGDQSHRVVVAMTTKVVIIKITHPQNSEAPSYSLKKPSSNTEIKSIETRRSSTSNGTLASGSKQTLS